MTSIVITPHEPEHAGELRDFIVNELDNADFNVDMPASVRVIDVNRLLLNYKKLLNTVADMTQLAFDATQYREATTAESKQIQAEDRARINRAVVLMETLSKEAYQ